ncbi:unnamed protein product [Spirodela intermedia]|uniref:TOG domain-containing protein n=1 Tax=Spirodela intermedia TaxID=51605 RepID=A0A7I8JRV4_SPIIN|nr:unnamed protein product [Spirodela intermedia]CAA6672491.1 unnamed protein product [Spirodela intermedia]
MSGKALRDLNTVAIPGLERKTESSSKGTLIKSQNGQMENLENGQTKIHVPMVCGILNEEVGSNGVETVNEVEYIESENLTELTSVDESLSLESKIGFLCESLNNVRQIAIYSIRKNCSTSMVVKSLKNPRSAVCKTAIMTSADIFKVYCDQIIDSLDPLLLQLLLKSSQDKKFVCDAAERALVSMTTWVSPSQLLPKLQPYLKHRNPRIRAKASLCFCRSVPQLGVDGIRDYGIDKLIQVAAAQLNDQLPESREAARKLVVELHSVFMAAPPPPPPDDSWEGFCRSKLSPLSAQAILRLTTGGN